MNQLISKTFSTTSIIVLLRVILLGASVCELYFFVNALFLKVWTLLLIGNAAIIIFAFASIGIILGVWILIRRLLIGAFRILKATRIDVVLSFTLGILISASIGGFGSEYYRNLIWSMQPYTILAILMISFLFFLSFGIRYIKLKLELLKTVHDAFFVFDSEQISKKNDLLGFSDKAEKFGERVMNRGSKNSMVYGIDAPWGIGKSSFVNLCIEYWEETYTHQVVVFKFSPLMYESTSDLLEKFVDGIITAIQKTAYIPEIRPLVQKYTRLIKAKATLSFFGLEMTPWRQPIDEILKDLEVVLLGLNKKVIVVVDDLDRLNFSEVKDILYAVKKSFTLPNISYVLCYDTENISALEKDKPHFDKVTDFLEKFVNVKVSIFLDSKALQDYVSKNLVIALSGNSQADHGLVSIAIGGLIEIYQSQEFNQYLPYIGDVRKLKRLINTLLLLEIEKSDFDNTDFNKSDLINLLLIYINYPNVFRKIYNAETLGKRGFFSAVVPRDPGYPEENSTKGPPAGQPATFETSIYYREFLKTLTPNQIFLLNKVFDVKARLVSPAIDSVPEVVKTSYACFNGAWSGKNLEQYLNLIVNQSKPQKETQHKYYLNLKNQIIGGKPFEEVFAVEQLSFEDGEINLEKLWNIIIGSLDEFKGETGGQLINYLVQNIRRYSLIEIENISIGLRKRLGFFLVKILNKIGWSDEFGMHANNSEENIAEIAEWIFGERRHTKQGLLYSLSKEEKGILGLFDLLIFRLYCSADRGGDVFDVVKSLARHNNPAAPTEGPVSTILIEEMREISQLVFKIFESQYISNRKNVFELTEKLTLEDFLGDNYNFVERKISSGEVIRIQDLVEATKSQVKSFVVYQLGSSHIESGVGCGYFDVEGKGDKHQIQKRINDYLFDICFNPEIAKGNYEHFLDYLMLNFASTYKSFGGLNYKPYLNEFTRVIFEDRLSKYWNLNGDAIKASNFGSRDKTIRTGNYTANYNVDLPGIFDVLDMLVKEKQNS